MGNLGKRLHSAYRSTLFSDYLRKRRFDKIEHTTNLKGGERIVEVGCLIGRDFIQYAGNYDCTGIDIVDVPHANRLSDFRFVRCDAGSIPFDDAFFDVAVSVGVLEHIQPIEKLCQVTSEIRLISKRFCVIVPSNGTWVEFHTWSLFWQNRSINRKRHSKSRRLNYYSDEASLQFPGFLDAKAQRFWYAPFVQNLMIVG